MLVWKVIKLFLISVFFFWKLGYDKLKSFPREMRLSKETKSVIMIRTTQYHADLCVAITWVLSNKSLQLKFQVPVCRFVRSCYLGWHRDSRRQWELCQGSNSFQMCSSQLSHTMHHSARKFFSGIGLYLLVRGGQPKGCIYPCYRWCLQSR